MILRPEYAPKKIIVNNPPAARPPIVATIQSGTRPASLIQSPLKIYFNSLTNVKLFKLSLVEEIT